MNALCRIFGHRALTIYLPIPRRMCRRCWKEL